MRAYTLSPRNTGGFSLDDAARAYRSTVTPDDVAQCPQCGVPMVPVHGEEHAEFVLILRCGDCGRGVVLRRSSGPSLRMDV